MDGKFEQTVENNKNCHTINKLDSLKILNLEVVGGPRTRVLYPKINLPTQANKRNQAPKITLTRGGLREQMATGTSKSRG